MQKSRYIVGIDLGTTNCVVAFADTSFLSAKSTDKSRKKKKNTEIQIFEIAQLSDSGEVKSFFHLPSFLYIPSTFELGKNDFSLTWAKKLDFIVGVYARNKGALIPGRLVSSAKSWLCNSAVDRKAKILPWDAYDDVKKISPVTATMLYLEHIKECWNFTFASKDKNNSLENQEVIITVPASFDNSARELTVEAAEKAGLQNFVLIEEPQSAFYAWLYKNQGTWNKKISVGELILVCDVGGGTTDFSLIQLEKAEGKLGFKRIAVGEHLMLGGDNIDLALAANIEKKLLRQNQKLDSAQWLMLQAACRAAKEEILSSEIIESKKITIPGRTSKIIGGALSAELNKEEITKIILEGFFPETTLEDMPAKKTSAGLQEFGLPYAFDAAITKHLAAFLKNPEVQETLAFRRPDKILFNGGVFKSEFIQKRIFETLKRWFPENNHCYSCETRLHICFIYPEKQEESKNSGFFTPLRSVQNDSDNENLQQSVKKIGRPKKQLKSDEIELLEIVTGDLDTAVATGAVYFGLGRRGKGVKITSGSAQSYYIGIDSPNRDEIYAICICPQGLAEGEEINIENQNFELRINQPVSFPLYNSRVRPLDEQGDIIKINPENINQLPPICTVLKIQQDSENQKENKALKTLKVTLNVKLTEVGVLETWCVSEDKKHRWRLQLEVRGKNEAETETDADSATSRLDEDEIIAPEKIEQAINIIEKTFTDIALNDDAKNHPNKLMKNLEQILERKRTDWSISTLRKLFEPMLKFMQKRNVNPLLEVRWLNLTGFLLRPGFGAPLDDWRINEIWKIFEEDIYHQRNLQVRSEWWILWRRIAAGLSKPQQLRIYEKIAPVLLPKSKTAKKKGKTKINATPQEEIEMLRTIASLEKIHASEKKRLGEFLLSQIEEENAQPQMFWALGRFGARVLFNAPIDTVISKNVAENWIERLLKCNIAENSEGLFAVAQLARMTGDRSLDISDEIRSKVLRLLKAKKKDYDFSAMINKIGHLKIEEQARIFGEALPPALKLIQT